MTGAFANLFGAGRWAAALTAAALVVSACGGAAAPAATGPASSAPTVAASAAAPTPSGPPQKLAVEGLVADPAFAPLWAAKILGYFKAQNLDVQITTSPNLVSDVVSGRVDIAFAGVAAAFAPVKDGKGTSIIWAETGNGSSNEVFAAADSKVRTISDCTRLATGQPTTALYSWAVYDKAQFNASYAIIPFSDLSAAVATVVSGQNDCGLAPLAQFVPLVNSGKLKVVFKSEDTPAAAKVIPIATVWGLTANLQAKKGAVSAFLKALSQGVTYVQGHTAADVATLLRQDADFQPFQLPALTTSVGQAIPKLAPSAGYIDEASWPRVVTFYKENLGGSAPDAALYSYKQRVDMSYYEAGIGKPKN